MRVDLEHVIAHPVERVFAVMSDPARRPHWQERTSDVEVLTPGPTALGTRWRETSRGIGAVEATVVGFEAHALWVEAGTAGGGDGRVTVRFAREGEGATRLIIVAEIHLKGLRRAMEGALKQIVVRQMPHDLVRLEALLGAGRG
jgi:uncharacterized protein YndB with AHSA1/START domain